jgi:ferrous iron transport protein B
MIGHTQISNASNTVRIALAGAPNAGKSTLFNRLTGGNQKIGNYPGVTVEKKSGAFLTPGGRRIELVDLPGTYSLDAQSEDERVAVKTIFQSRDQSPALVVVVLDAANLERSLGLVLDFKKTGCTITGFPRALPTTRL